MNDTLGSARAPRWALAFACLGLLGYAIFIGWNFAPVASGSDASGYMHAGRLLARGEFGLELRPVPGLDAARPIQATPLGFFPFRYPSQVQPTYPAGLPLHLAAAYLVLGEKWGTLCVGVFGALLTVLATFGVGRRLGLNAWLAAGCATALGLSPVLLFTSFIPFSDTLAAGWFTASLYFALRSREAWQWSIAAGLACALAVLVRPTTVVACAPLALVLWHWRALLGAILGGLPGVLFLLFYQSKLYGSPFQTGYADFSGWAYDHANFLGTLRNYGTWLPRLLPAAVLGLVVWPFLPWRKAWRGLAAAYLCFVLLFLFYGSYDVSQQAWWYLRFILPVLPPLVVFTGLAIQVGIERWSAGVLRPRLTFVAAALLALSPLAILYRWEREIHVFLLKPYQQLYLDVPVWAKQHLPPEAIVTTQTLSGTFYFSTEFAVLRWDQLEKGDFARFATAAQEAKRPIYAALLRHEIAEAIPERLPGRWEKLTEIDICSIYRYLGPE
jgi:hypothetical protein